MMKKQWIAGLAALTFMGGASAQDPVGNFYLAVDTLVINLDGVLDNLVVGDATGVANGLNITIGDFVTQLAQDTAAESLAAQGLALGDQLVELGTPLYTILDQLAAPGAEALAPFAQIYLDANALSNGAPFINGREVVIFRSGASGALGALGIPAAQLADILGSNGQLSMLLGPILAAEGFGGGLAFFDSLGGGGFPIIGSFLGGESSGGFPVIGDLLGGDLLAGGIPIIGGLLGGEGGDLLAGGIPIIGGLLGGEGGALLGGGIPIIGGLLGGEGGFPGLDAILVLLSPEQLTGLLGGLSLPGMGGA